MLINYLKIALRRLRQDRFHTGINVLGLALGMTGCLVIFIFVRYELNFDAFHTNSDQIFRVVEHHRKADGIQHWPTTAYPLAEAIRNDISGVGVTQIAGPMDRVISATDNKGNVVRFEEDRVMFADKYYLQTFDFSKAMPQRMWLAGNAEKAFSQDNAVVLTEKLADRYFADYAGRYDEILGKTLMLNNSDHLTVSGIIRNPPHNTNLLFDMLVNYAFFKASNRYQANNWSGNYQGTVYVTLGAGMSVKALETQLAQLEKKYMNAEDQRDIQYVLQPLREAHTDPTYSDFTGSYRVSKQMLLGLSSLAVFLILIAAFNFINLTTAQASKRSKEVGVRKSVGSSQYQLFAQFIGETCMISALAGLISLSGLDLLLNWLNHSLTLINLQLQMDLSVWLFAAGMVLVVALLAGGYPAIILSRFQPIKALKNISDTPRRGFSLRHGLIVMQFCITYSLIVGMLVASRQMNFFMNKNLGFARDAVVTINAPKNQVPGKMDVFREQLKQNPAVKEVSFSSGAPITRNYYGTSFRLPSEDSRMDRQAEMKIVDLNYQSLFDLKTVAGRWFSLSNVVKDGEAFNGFVINETMAKMLGLTPETAIGKIVKISEGEAPVIGVVKDFHNVSLQQAITPCVLMVWNTGFYEQIQVRLSAADGHWAGLQSTLGMVEKTWKRTFPQDVYEYTFLNDSLAKGYVVEQLVFDAFRIFALISIFIACLGLLGLIAFTSAQRTKEIGVRKVLGASVASIVALLSQDFLKLIFIAILLAAPAAWYAMHRWLQSFEYKVNIEWWIFALAAFLAVGIALLTVSYQSIRAALVNPVRSLKSE
ncbi:ABC transporter permease [Dyadobacter luticola]|uniref:FtsX-like permease family protein n=1 Tax=Dyadobacter luticola TaxID=1979387 RepID=A0A5R9KXZ1_9BACT|nr:ABC transporter permease [Dyadobacter luticola]TLV01028.1 FtsX-like permease family protein [Dyadobacter luticola]